MKKIITASLILIFGLLTFLAGRGYEAFHSFSKGTVWEEVMLNFQSFEHSMAKGMENDDQISALRMLAVLKDLDGGNPEKIKAESIKYLAQFCAESPNLPDGIKEDRNKIKQRIWDYAEASTELKQELTANQLIDPTWTTPVLKAKFISQAGHE